jgi:uncharacterized protein YecA (UPF0149 family)
MELFEQWKAKAAKERSQADNDDFWTTYLEKEKTVYEYLLENYKSITEGPLSELSEKFGMDPSTFTGFLDGINTSLVKEIELDEVKEDSAIKLEIDFEKLYWNMLEAKADWLYTLEQWDEILTPEKRSDITKEFRQSKIAVSSKVGRNDPCPCGSGKKYKKCCGK